MIASSTVPPMPPAPPDAAVRSRAAQPERDEPFNIATDIVDRHVHDGRGDHVAMRFVRDDPDDSIDYTYQRLADDSDAVAAALLALGVTAGDAVFLLAGRTPQLYVAALGAWKAGAVICPLFAAFGPEPIRQRLELGDARVLVTTASLYRRKIAAMHDQLSFLDHIVITDDDAPPAGTTSLTTLIESHRHTSRPTGQPSTRRDDPAILHFTSGTTGTPKGAVHVHGAVESHLDTARRVLGLVDTDVYWCTADPGWVTGISYGLIAPLAVGATAIVDEAEFDAERWYRILERERVDVWYTAPTAIRMLMRAGSEVAERHDLSALRSAFSVGEPLSAHAVRWCTEVLDRPIRDTWWQTETGSIMIANTHDAEVRPGSMGRPVDGVEIALLECDELDELQVVDGTVTEIHEPDRLGMIAIRPGWPSMFRDYLNAPGRYRAAFVDGWYVAGDLARRDADGYYWFVGRADDVIKTAGHLIGPFEVESVLTEHPDIVGAGVYGIPDDVAGEVIHAEVVVRTGADPDTAITDLRAHARRTLGPALAPRTIRSVDELPYTRSGKVMRRLLRARALGLPEGDTSTLEATT